MNEEDSVHAWREVLAKYAATACALERELSERHRLGMSEFEVLERMVEGGQGKYRVQEIADAVHLSQSACSRLIARLEKAGLVTRCICEDDRRGIFVGITDDGRARHATASPTHRAVIGEIFGSPAREQGREWDGEETGESRKHGGKTREDDDGHDGDVPRPRLSAPTALRASS
ncbi:MarR family winged helix-turn-helix transcriptional regulator [Streptosporangium sp. G11]|uniref:MarR family winged helix-turn-helix transcriptional regulator n=1 Tax=Streptosporangium sp. G11 TaxID=3436926 RepID=UPI003EBE96AC